MKKIPCLFVREFKMDRTFTITDAVSPGCEWVLAGEGIATRKWDGTAVLVRDGVLYARYDAKHGKSPPPGAIPCTEEPDSVTGHWPHWVRADRPQDKWIREAAVNAGHSPDGTYEAIGPNIGVNADGWSRHMLIPHGHMMLHAVPRTFAGLREHLASLPWEGIVFHHEDGRMAKIRRDDFGLPWPMPSAKLG